MPDSELQSVRDMSDSMAAACQDARAAIAQFIRDNYDVREG